MTPFYLIVGTCSRDGLQIGETVLKNATWDETVRLAYENDYIGDIERVLLIDLAGPTIKDVSDEIAGAIEDLSIGDKFELQPDQEAFLTKHGCKFYRRPEEREYDRFEHDRFQDEPYDGMLDAA